MSTEPAGLYGGAFLEPSVILTLEPHFGSEAPGKAFRPPPVENRIYAMSIRQYLSEFTILSGRHLFQGV